MMTAYLGEILEASLEDTADPMEAEYAVAFTDDDGTRVVARGVRAYADSRYEGVAGLKVRPFAVGDRVKVWRSEFGGRKYSFLEPIASEPIAFAECEP